MNNNNYIGFPAGPTLGGKTCSVITYIKATEAHDAEQIIAKSTSCVEHQLIQMRKCNLVINLVRYRVINTWNGLSGDLCSSSSLCAFKNMLRQLYLSLT